MKKYLFVALLLLSALHSRGQAMGFLDMADLVRLNVAQVDNILISTGKYRLNNKSEVNGQIINEYQSIDKNRKVVKGETFLVGAFRTTNDGVQLYTITYRTIYPEYINNLMKQMVKYGYHLTLKGADKVKDIYIYDNALNHVTISMPTDHSLNTIDIRQKDGDLER